MSPEKERPEMHQCFVCISLQNLEFSALFTPQKKQTTHEKPGFPDVFIGFPWFFHGFSMFFPWFFYGFPHVTGDWVFQLAFELPSMGCLGCDMRELTPEDHLERHH